MKSINFFAFVALFAIVLTSCGDDATPTTYSGALADTEKISFKTDDDNCEWTVTYSNNNLSVTLDELKSTVTAAQFTTKMTEEIVKDCGLTVAPANNHTYDLISYIITGNSIEIVFDQDDNSTPKNNATFSGTFIDEKLAGKVTLKRELEQGSNLVIADIDISVDLAAN